MTFRRIPNMQNLNQLRGDMERMAHDFLGNVGAWPQVGVALVGNRAFPPLNVWESDDCLRAEAELPGVEPGNVDISVEGLELTIKGERKADESKGATYHRRERGAGSFSRTVRLPFEVDAGAIQATLRDGLLSIVLPKAEAAKPRKIPVNVS